MTRIPIIASAVLVALSGALTAQWWHVVAVGGVLYGIYRWRPCWLDLRRRDP